MTEDQKPAARALPHASRRNLFRWSAAAGLAAFAPTANPAAATTTRKARIGARFVAEHGHAAASRLLAAAPAATPLADRIAGDFRAGRTVAVGGFLLAESEVADCLCQAWPNGLPGTPA